MVPNRSVIAADDDEFHDVALAAEKFPLFAPGHEVTSAPSDDDQGESIRNRHRGG